MFNFKCPFCDKKFSAGIEGSGRKTTCPKCKNRFRIPEFNVFSPKSEVLNSESNFLQDSNIKETQSASDSPQIVNINLRQRLLYIGYVPIVLMVLGLFCYFLILIFPMELTEQVQISEFFYDTRGKQIHYYDDDTGRFNNGRAQKMFLDKPLYEKRKVTDNFEIRRHNFQLSMIPLLIFVGGFYLAQKRYRNSLGILQKQIEFDSKGWMPAIQIHQEFLENEIATKDMYESFRVNIYGKVTKIDERVIELDQVIQCKSGFLGFPKQLLISLKKGEIVYVAGKVKIISKIIYLENCMIERE